jgi:hypothetical protein
MPYLQLDTIVGLKDDNFNLEFTLHAGDEMYHALRRSERRLEPGRARSSEILTINPLLNVPDYFAGSGVRGFLPSPRSTLITFVHQ